eukprot:TRINITY_DN6809_c1_g1_i5.p1 TRINITY_DN6809_c1_g1~~TRINITY_DN6809_c1_g1_i5.p1  ORF type:complete len:565 (+),score=110.35 TRINITY_DN6809_c1_g1_i5:74-1696(+)
MADAMAVDGPAPPTPDTPPPAAVADPAEPMRCGSGYAEYAKWVAARGVKLHKAVEAKAIPEMGGGAGIVATQPLPAGAVIAAAPPKAVFSTRRIREAPALAALLEEPQCAALRPLQKLVLLLAHEARDECSQWEPWISRLPQSYETLIEAPEEAVDRLRSRRRIEKVRHERRVVEAMHRECVDAVGGALRNQRQKRGGSPSATAAERLEQLRAPPPTRGGRGLPVTAAERLEQLSQMSHAEFRTWYCCVCSRGFYFNIDASRGDVWGLIPWLDYFNYTDGDGHRAAMNRRSGCFEVSLTSDVDSGEQILLHYGTYPNFELLLWYGFALLGSNKNQEYKLSALADANGNVPAGVDWARELVGAMRAHPPDRLGAGCWAGVRDAAAWEELCGRFESRGVDEIRMAQCAANWSLGSVGGRGVVSLAQPPVITSELQTAMYILAASVPPGAHAPSEQQGSGDGLTRERVAWLLRSLCLAEQALSWTGPPRGAVSPSHRDPGAVEAAGGGALDPRVVSAVADEEQGLLALLCSLPLEAWLAALTL